MFLNKTIERNKKLIEASFQLHQDGTILPDTYVIDIDTLKQNAQCILDEANKQNIDLYFMLKQLGRNPYIANELVKMGYKGAVVVDFEEAEIMMKYGIPICNVGHLVQPPKNMIQQLINYGCQYFTVFSLEKIKLIDECAKKLNKKQKLLIKVVSKSDVIYSGQTAGFQIEDLPHLIDEIKKLENVQIAGVTSFPCFLYDEDSEKIEATPNLHTLEKAKTLLEKEGIHIENLNAPSTTSTVTLREMAHYSIDSGEPGHGLSGTTPLHAHKECVEIPCVTYVSEISHNFDEKAYCFGGGYYRRSHVGEALVGTSLETCKKVKILPPSLESIDYYFGLAKECKVHESVVMSFRFQIFVTRSRVAIVNGIQSGNLQLEGIYTSLGEKVK